MFKKILSFLGLKKEKIIFFYNDLSRSGFSPLEVGYVLAMLKKEGFFRRYDFEILPMEYPYDAQEISQDILAAHPRAVFFFTDNWAFSLLRGTEMAKKIAKKIKAENPEIFIGLQSYKFDFESARRIFATRAIDCVIQDYTEKDFLALSDIINNKKTPIVARSLLEFEKNREMSPSSSSVADSPKNLDELPSPYLSGVMDGFLEKTKKKFGDRHAYLLQSSRGCPFKCYYCPRAGKFKKTEFFSAERFYDEIEYLVSRFGFYNFFVADDVFVFSKERLLEFRKEFERRKKENKKLENISFLIEARIEALDEENIVILRDLNVTDIQIGLQTINPDLQHYMNRKVEMEKFRTAAAALKKANIDFLIDIISGLPGDSVEWFEKTVDFAISLSPSRIQAKQLFLTSGTRFWSEKEKLGLKTQRFEFEPMEPYVIEANNVDEAYHKKIYSYIKKKKEENSQIKWLISFRDRSIVPSNFIAKFKLKIVV